MTKAHANHNVHRQTSSTVSVFDPFKFSYVMQTFPNYAFFSRRQRSFYFGQVWFLSLLTVQYGWGAWQPTLWVYE